MKLTSDLLYLLLLYSVLDKDGKLPLTVGVVVGCVILLLRAHADNKGLSDNIFSSLNGF